MTVTKSIFKSIFKSYSRGFAGGETTGPDQTNLLAYYRTTISDGKLQAVLPRASHTTPQVKGSGFAGAGSATVTGLLTTDTITASGPSDPTCTVDGTLTFPGPDCWDIFVHRAGVLWAYWPGMNAGQTTELDASPGTGYHLTGLVGTTITERLDGSGTNYANEAGFTVADGENYFYDFYRTSFVPSGTILPSVNGAPPVYKSAIDYDGDLWAMTPTTNLALNPGFETLGGGGADVFSTWLEYPDVAGYITADADVKHSGTQSARLLAGAAKLTRITQRLTVAPGNKIKFSFYTRGDGTNPGRYQIVDYSNGNVAIIGITSTGVSGSTFELVTIYLDIPVTNPLPCTEMVFYFLCPAVTDGYAYFDDVRVEVADCPGYSSGGIKILGVGDSKTVGIGDGDLAAGGGWLGRFPSVQRYSAGYSGFVEAPLKFGRSGKTVANWATLISTHLTYAIGTPDYVCINLGTNDLPLSPVEATWKADYLTIIDALHAKWPLAVIKLMRPWQRGYNAEADTMAGWIDDLVAARPAFVLLGPDERDFLEAGNDGVTYTVEGLHPNALGYDLTAREWINLIDPQWATNAAITTYSGPLGIDAPITGTTITAPLGADFQAISTFTGGAEVDLATLVPTAQVRTGSQGTIVRSVESDAATIARDDRVVGA